MSKFKHLLLENAPHWYVVTDDAKKVYAFFSLIDAKFAKPASGKHMDLKFTEEVTEDIIENGNMSLLLDIYAFVFNTVLTMTHDLAGVGVCKIHSHDDMTRMVYNSFARELGGEYDVKNYGKWLEIHKKP